MNHELHPLAVSLIAQSLWGLEECSCPLAGVMLLGFWFLLISRVHAPVGSILTQGFLWEVWSGFKIDNMSQKDILKERQVDIIHSMFEDFGNFWGTFFAKLFLLPQQHFRGPKSSPHGDSVRDAGIAYVDMFHLWIWSSTLGDDPLYQTSSACGLMNVNVASSDSDRKQM